MRNFPVFLSVLLLIACGMEPPAPAGSSSAPAADPLVEAREILKEMVEVNTTLKDGNVSLLAERLAARFRDAGVPDSDIVVMGSDDRSHNLIVRLRGTGPARPVLFMGHLDVVPALRTDWTEEPFTVTEKDGWLYGRGTLDDKGPSTTLVAAALALFRSGKAPARDVIFAFCANEEAGDDGAEWLIANHRELVDAEFVFNFDAGGPVLGPDSAIRYLGLQGAEKVYWTVELEVKNRGGHSSQPREDNAIYQLSDALLRLQRYRFPVNLTEVQREGMRARIPFVPAAEAGLLRAALAEPLSNAAIDRLIAYEPLYNAALRTTCVPTMLRAGQAENALPAEAAATVNCRLIPGESADATLDQLRRIIADTGVVFRVISEAKPSPPSPLLPERLAMVTAASLAAWGRPVPIVPIQEVGATDGLFFRNAGIPVYGVHGIALPEGEDRMHGNDERIPVKSFEQGVRFATALVQAAAETEMK